MHITRTERSWLIQVFETVLPLSADPRFGVTQQTYGLYIDDLMVRAPRHMTLGLRASLWLVQLLPLFMLGRLRLFSNLSLPQRLRVLDRLADNSVFLLRELPLFFKMTACLGLGGLPSVQGALAISPTDPTPAAWTKGTCGTGDSPGSLPILKGAS